MSLSTWSLAIGLALISINTFALEGRGFNPITSTRPVTPGPANFGMSLSNNLPKLSRGQCEGYIGQAIGSYGNGSFRQFLDPSFPNANLLTDAINRAQSKITNISLGVQAIQRISIGPWQKAGGGEGLGPEVYKAVCTVTLRTKLSFDSASSGTRIVGDGGKSEWQITFTARERP